MKKEYNYTNEGVSSLYKYRANTFHEVIPSELILDEDNKVWKVSTTLPIDKENCLLINILFFEEVIAFEVAFKLPDHFNNDIFKHKVNGKDEFKVLDKYNSRVYICENYKDSFLIMNVAYVFTEEGEKDSYSPEIVADILAYIGQQVKDELVSYTKTKNIKE